MKKTFLLVCFLSLLAGLKAQQAKSKNTDITEHREGGNPALKAQQEQVKKDTAQLNAQQTVKTNSTRTISSDRKVDSIRQLLINNDTVIRKPSIKKPYKEPVIKPAAKAEAKRKD